MDDLKHDEQEEMFSVTEMCRRAGVTPAQLRNWDVKGVLVARRAGEGVSNNRKLYAKSDVETVKDVLMLQELGLGLDEISKIVNEPDEKRKAKMLAQHSDAMRKRYSALEHRMMVTGVAEALGLERVVRDVEEVSSTTLLIDAYAADENLRLVSRWMKSHTQDDVDAFAKELLSVSEEFSALAVQSVEHAADWDALDVLLAKFCDVWSVRFGWPSVGDMLQLSEAFAEKRTLTSDIDDALGEGTCAFMSRAFRLGWASNALEVLNEILCCMYLKTLDGSAVDDLSSGVITEDEAERIYVASTWAGEVLVALICELSGKTYLVDASREGEAKTRLCELAVAVFDEIENVVLDDDTSELLRLEDFEAIDGPAFEMLHSLADAAIRGRTHVCMYSDAMEQVFARRSEWLDTLRLEWENDQDSSDGAAGNFDEWLHERYAELMRDPPETTWASEDDSCAREKLSREKVQRAKTR